MNYQFTQFLPEANLSGWRTHFETKGIPYRLYTAEEMGKEGHDIKPFHKAIFINYEYDKKLGRKPLDTE